MAYEMERFVFLDQEYAILEELLNAMAENWEEGKEILFNGDLMSHIQSLDPAFAGICIDARREAAHVPESGDGEKADLAYFIWLLRMPGERPLIWKGEALKDFEPVAETLRQICRQESSYYQKRYVFPLMREFLLEDRDFEFDGQSFADPEALADWLQKIADQSPAKFRNKGSKLFLDDTHLDPVFYGWLFRCGKTDALEAWNRKYQRTAEETGADPCHPVSFTG